MNVLIQCQLKWQPSMGPEEIEMRIIGKRAGEKLYEELMTEEEAGNPYESKILIFK